jgi:protein-L-isoaspartate O-methyltransferase
MREGVADAARLAEARYALHRRLAAGSPLLAPRLAAAFLYVPRHPFLPWHEAVGGGELPLAQAEVLDALDVRPGSRVLEVGTGSGYGTALLCWLAGASNVTSTDAAPEVVERARERLECVGYRPVLAVAGADAGCGRRAPFDRLVANVAVQGAAADGVAAAWLAECAPGAVLVARVAGAVARLEVRADGTAAGRFLPTSVADPLPGLAAPGEAYAGWPGLQRPTRVPGEVLEDRAFAFFARLHLPDAAHGVAGGHLLETPDGAHAHVAGHTVTVGGQRDLWAVVERAHAGWLALHRPRREWFEIHVGPDHQRVTYRTPHGAEHHWDLPPPARPRPGRRRAAES